jgi:hypothetical protein
MEDNPLLPFTVAMTVGVTLVILARAALSVWRHGEGIGHPTPRFGARTPGPQAPRHRHGPART